MQIVYETNCFIFKLQYLNSNNFTTANNNKIYIN